MSLAPTTPEAIYVPLCSPDYLDEDPLIVSGTFCTVCRNSYIDNSNTNRPAGQHCATVRKINGEMHLPSVLTYLYFSVKR